MSTRLLAATVPGAPAALARHLAVHGPAPVVGPSDRDALVRVVAEAGLRGRGGAGFPTARKLAAVAANASARRRPVVVVNGTEGEPASAKDRLLLTTQPHLVLDGAVLAATAVGAPEVEVVVPGPAMTAVERALDERVARGVPDGVRVRLHRAATGYVAGEETAVLAHLEGQAPKPRRTPPRPVERGLHGRPTLVQNAETLAHLATIARHGAAWFRQAGTAERPGTTLVTLSGAVARPGVHEVAVGAPLPALLAAAGGGREPLRGLLVGGYFGAWVPADAPAALTDTALRPLGAAVGAGVVIALGRSACPVRTTARLADYMAEASAGQCGPCVHGLAAVAGALAALADGSGGPRQLDELERWTAMVDGRGACAHPTGAVRMVASATRVFAAELHDHARHGACAGCAASGAPPSGPRGPLGHAATAGRPGPVGRPGAVVA